MSLDLLDRLISDICSVTEQLMNMDKAVEQLDVFQPAPSTVEKQHSSAGLPHHEKHKARRPMKEGVHRSVC